MVEITVTCDESPAEAAITRVPLQVKELRVAEPPIHPQIQYAGLYTARLGMLERELRTHVKQEWPDIVVKDIADMVVSSHEVAGVGVLFKNMRLKPSALDSLLHKLKLGEAKIIGPSADDSLWLEDLTARVDLQWPGDFSKLVTGLVLAIRGRYDSTTGKVIVSDFLFPPLPEPALPDFQACIALISAPEWGHPASLEQSCNLRDWLSGQYPDDDDLPAARINHLIVVGDVLGLAPSDKADLRRYVSRLDSQVTDFARTVPLTLVPGPKDPTTYSLPQKPLHQCIAKHASLHGAVMRAGNPARLLVESEEGRVHIVCMGNQGEGDVRSYTSVEDALESVELCVRARCLAPTAPDTLCCFPFGGELDPFVLQADDFPAVIAVQSDKFDYKKLDNGTTIICLPPFTTTGCAAVLDLSSGVVSELSFKLEEA
ncbi:MAG: hypothetical protein KVP17_003741 [Porospora cf. gigantea B]|uniref:uncharacterized protein n=1 Tax=Porospora cf. gigantea B TaxID=2853592 RepID=UPI003571B339|nr:MAG: hypothetical protein KVP17_003741 [Porospora cf. gigantea B]